jgi:integrase
MVRKKIENSTKRTRRDNRTGSTPSLLSDGRWCSTVMLGYNPLTGKPNKVNKFGKTSAECKRNMKKFLEEYNSKKIKITPKMKATDYFDHWLIDYKKGEIKDSSYDRLVCAYENNILPYIKNLQLKQITPQLIKSLLDIANVNGLSQSSIKKIFEVLRPALNVAVSEELIAENPVCKVKMLSKNKIKTKTKQITIYSKEDVEAMIHTVSEFYDNLTRKTYIHFPIFPFIINTGLRISECMALTWDDLKFDGDGYYIEINKSLSRSAERNENNEVIGRKVTLEETKTQAGNRHVPLNDIALQSLKQVKEINNILNINCEFIFATREHNHTTIGRVQKSFSNLLKLANINENLGIHSLRHLFGSSLANIPEISIKDISELMGHTDVSFTLNTYIHSNHIVKRKAVNLLSKETDISIKTAVTAYDLI